MDNLTHTLVGAALGQSGLKRRSGLSMPALMISANLPDVDVVYALVGEGLSGRRGWTHGPIGLLLLPALLAGALVLFDRWQARRATRPAGRPPIRPGQLLLLCYVGALSHPLLDLMNNWGIRLLMPFSERWFYGDTLFIADPWIWLTLGGGIWLSRRREQRGELAMRPAIMSITAVLAYSIAMAGAGRAAERRAVEEIETLRLGHPQRVLASPVFADPFRRQIVFQIGDRYGFGEFRWLPRPVFTLGRNLIATHMDDPAIALARQQDRAAADFLYWSRYPFADVRRTAGTTTVALGDARFGARPSGGLMGVTSTFHRSAVSPGGMPPAASINENVSDRKP